MSRQAEAQAAEAEAKKSTIPRVKADKNRNKRGKLTYAVPDLSMNAEFVNTYTKAKLSTDTIKPLKIMAKLPKPSKGFGRVVFDRNPFNHAADRYAEPVKMWNKLPDGVAEIIPQRVSKPQAATGFIFPTDTKDTV